MCLGADLVVGPICLAYVFSINYFELTEGLFDKSRIKRPDISIYLKP